jgi:hypothetical protein
MLDFSRAATLETAMDRNAFIVGQNLARFRELLGREQDPAKRRLLERLIEEELGKLAESDRPAEPPTAPPEIRDRG